jgi:hypothetical protein
MTALAEARCNCLVENVGTPLPIPRGRAIVPYLHLLTFVPPPSYSMHTTPARQHLSVPVVRWFDGYEGKIQRDVVTVIGAQPAQAKRRSCATSSLR